MYPAGFEYVIPAGEWSQIHSLGRAATRVGRIKYIDICIFKPYIIQGFTLSVYGELICTSVLLLLGRPKPELWDMWQIWRRRYVCGRLWWEELKVNEVPHGRVVLELVVSTRKRETG
jgi:hypothetical protein